MNNPKTKLNMVLFTNCHGESLSATHILILYLQLIINLLIINFIYILYLLILILFIFYIY